MILKTKVEILNWLEQHDHQYKWNIKNNYYEFIDIHDDINQSLLNSMIEKDNLPPDYFEQLKLEAHQYIVNANGSINISNEELQEIPIQFYQVDGNFNCGYNQLISLDGGPQIINGHFDCSHNQLSSLKYGPQSVGTTFSCAHNQLTSLEYCPSNIKGNSNTKGNFYCHNNQLKSLQGCPQSIDGDFFCNNNQLFSLEYFPEKVDGLIYLQNNPQLLKYKNYTNKGNIQNMSDKDFFNQNEFQFWHQFYLQEKYQKENHKIIDDLNLNDQINNNKSSQSRIIKV